MPLRFLENRIRTLSRTSVPHNLRCLDQHKDNMQRMLTEQDWERLSAEQLNASRTVQVSSVCYMESVRYMEEGVSELQGYHLLPLPHC